MMASRKTSISVAITGDVRDLKRAFGEAESAAQQMSRKLDRIGNTLTLGVTLPLAAMGGAAVKAASDLEEALDKTDAIFGASAGEIKAWAETSAEAMGLASAEALDAAGNMGNMLQSAGFASAEAADLSMNLVQLAADMGSLNNVDPGEMLIKLQAGLAGEAEPLRRFGVDINAAAVASKALELGLVGVGEELTQQDKLAARYAIIMEQTATAQGNFADTADSAANQMRTLRGEVTNLAAEFGTHLLPIAKDVLEIANDLVGGFSDLDDETQKNIVRFGILAAAAGPLAKAAALMIRFGTAVAGVGTAFKTAGLGGAIIGLSSAALTATTAVGGLLAVFSAWESDRVLENARRETDGFTEALYVAIDSIPIFGDMLLGGAGAAERFGGDVERSKEEMYDLADAVGDSVGPMDDITGSMDDGAEAAGGFHEPLFALAEQFANVSGEAENTVKWIGATGQAMVDALNPVSQLRDANDRYGEALARVREVQQDTDATTQDLEEAQWDLIEATAGVQAANENLGSNWDHEGLLAAGAAAGFTADELNRLLASLGALDGARMDVVTVRQPGGGVRSITVDTERGATGGMGVFHDGGVVPGPIGMEQLAVVKGGETILPTHKQGFQGIGGQYTINVYNPQTSDVNSDVSKAMTAVRLLGVV